MFWFLVVAFNILAAYALYRKSWKLLLLSAVLQLPNFLLLSAYPVFKVWLLTYYGASFTGAVIALKNDNRSAALVLWLAVTIVPLVVMLVSWIIK